MIKFGRFHASLLVGCAAGLALVFFAFGFIAAVMLGEMDRDTAIAAATSAVTNSENFADEKRNLLWRLTDLARDPLYLAADLARVPVDEANAHLPGVLRQYDPLRAVDEIIVARQEEVADEIDNATAAVIVDNPTLDTSPPDTGAAAGEGEAATAPAPGGSGDPAQPAAAGDAPPAKPPEIPRRTVAPPPSAARGGAYAIELGSFRSPEMAEAFAVGMQQRQLPVSIVEAVDAGGRAWQRIRLGPYPSRAMADVRLRELQRREGLTGTVVQEAGPATADNGGAQPAKQEVEGAS